MLILKYAFQGGDECIDSDIFCSWLTSIFDLVDEDRFPEITSENQSAFVQEVRRRVSCTISIDSDCNDSEYEELDEDIPTDQSLNCDDSATLTSGIISISTSITDELETAKSVLGLPNMFVENVMVRIVLLIFAFNCNFLFPEGSSWQKDVLWKNCTEGLFGSYGGLIRKSWSSF